MAGRVLRGNIRSRAEEFANNFAILTLATAVRSTVRSYDSRTLEYDDQSFAWLSHGVTPSADGKWIYKGGISATMSLSLQDYNRPMHSASSSTQPYGHPIIYLSSSAKN